MGAKDYMDDDNRTFAVAIGPCSSADRRFDFGGGVLPALAMVNIDVPHPLITAVAPRTVPTIFFIYLPSPPL